jgi:hypothetical protein
MEPDMAWLVWVLFLAVIAAASCGFTVLGGYFLRRWLIEPGLTSLWALGVGAASLGVVCWLMFIYGEAYFTGSILITIWGTATVTALVFLWRSRRMGRVRMVVAGALLAVGYPALLLQMPGLYQIAHRDEWDFCSAPLVVDALARYRSVAGQYPPRFDELYREYPARSFGAPPRPTYEPLETVGAGGTRKCPASPQWTNWLYTTTGREYILGYWRQYPIIELLGARVCLYHSDDPGWRCEWNGWGPFVRRPEPTPSAGTSPSAPRTSSATPSTSQISGSLYLSPLGYSVELLSAWRRSDLQSRTLPTPQGDPNLLGVDTFTTRTPADEEAALRRSDTGVGPAQIYTASVALYRNSLNETPLAFAQRVKGGSGLVAVSTESTTVAGLAGVKTTFKFTTSDTQTFYTLYVQDRDWMWIIGYALAPSGVEAPAGATEQGARGIVESFKFRR